MVGATLKAEHFGQLELLNVDWLLRERGRSHAAELVVEVGAPRVELVVLG